MTTTENTTDLTGLKCPMPIVRLAKFVKEVEAGSEFTVVADDPAFCLDVESWCERTGHELMNLDKTSERFVARIRKCDA